MTLVVQKDLKHSQKARIKGQISRNLQFQSFQFLPHCLRENIPISPVELKISHVENIAFKHPCEDHSWSSWTLNLREKRPTRYGSVQVYEPWITAWRHFALSPVQHLHQTNWRRKLLECWSLGYFAVVRTVGIVMLIYSVSWGR